MKKQHASLHKKKQKKITIAPHLIHPLYFCIEKFLRCKSDRYLNEKFTTHRFFFVTVSLIKEVENFSLL